MNIFPLPEDGAAPAEVYAALDVLNAVKLTPEQFEGACRATWGNDWSGLVRHCAEHNLHPSDVAAQVVLLKSERVTSYAGGGYDVFGMHRDFLPDIVSQPLDYYDLGFCEEDMGVGRESPDAGAPLPIFDFG